MLLRFRPAQIQIRNSMGKLAETVTEVADSTHWSDFLLCFALLDVFVECCRHSFGGGDGFDDVRFHEAP